LQITKFHKLPPSDCTESFSVKKARPLKRYFVKNEVKRNSVEGEGVKGEVCEKSEVMRKIRKISKIYDDIGSSK
jgi:hypothetical protein